MGVIRTQTVHLKVLFVDSPLCRRPATLVLERSTVSFLFICAQGTTTRKGMGSRRNQEEDERTLQKPNRW